MAPSRGNEPLWGRELGGSACTALPKLEVQKEQKMDCLRNCLSKRHKQLHKWMWTHCLPQSSPVLAGISDCGKDSTVANGLLGTILELPPQMVLPAAQSARAGCGWREKEKRDIWAGRRVAGGSSGKKVRTPKGINLPHPSCCPWT